MTTTIIPELTQELQQKLSARLHGGKPLSESSIKLYLTNLRKLNDGEPIKNLKFLDKPELIKEKLADYKPTTARTFYIAIVSCLAVLKDKSKKMEKLWKTYTEQMLTLNKDVQVQRASGEKTETQAANWIEPEEIESKYEALKTAVDGFKDSAKINKGQYTKLLQYMVFSLYKLIPPRRNLDYQQMYVCKKAPTADEDKNFYDVDAGEFFFNRFKTAKMEGQIMMKVPTELKEVIDLYLKHQPLMRDTKKLKTFCIPFLVSFTGEKLDKINSITRVLNAIFSPKKIGSSMMRHFYLSNKYGDVSSEMKEDAAAMSHSIATQKEYILK